MRAPPPTPGRAVRRLDRLQRRRPVLGFAYAVVRKYAEDSAGREAALITYYGFLSIFPMLLLGVAVVSRVLVHRPEVRHELVAAMVPPALQSTVESAAAGLPTSPVPFAAGLVGLLVSGTGVVSSAYQTVNHLAAVPYRLRAGMVSRWLRVLAVLVLILAGAVAVGGLTVVVAALPGLPGGWRAVAAAGSAVTVGVVLLLAARLLLARPAPVAALSWAAVPGAVAVTVMLNAGAAILPRLVRQAGAVYGSFATVAGMFTLMYLLSQALVCCGEVAAVRRARLWPRGLDPDRPTAADLRALDLRARELERGTAERIESRIVPDPR